MNWSGLFKEQSDGVARPTPDSDITPYGVNENGKPFVQIEWHTKVEESTRKMTEKTAADTARELNCTRVRIRAGPHKTTYDRTTKERSPSEWHNTVEFWSPSKQQWGHAHLWLHAQNARQRLFAKMDIDPNPEIWWKDTSNAAGEMNECVVC